MAVSDSDNQYRLDRGLPVFSDVDKTLLKGDSGQEWLAEADIVERERFPEFIDSFYYDGLGHSNQLVEFLNRNQHLVDYLHDHVPEVDLEEREGLGAVLDHRNRLDVPNIGSSAGYRPVIEQVTNGNLHDVVAGELEQGEPVFNGQNEKRDRVESYLQEQGWESPYVAIGDSNGDIGKIKGAASSGGFGIAIAETVEEARERVDEATFYVGDENPEHYTSGALLNYLTLDDQYMIPPKELVDGYGFEISGRVEAGELADQEDVEALKEFRELFGESYE